MPIPPADGTWSEFFKFAHTYNGLTHLAPTPDELARIAYHPVSHAVRHDDPSLAMVGIDVLRGALFYMARADRFAGESDFGSEEEEGLYRAIISELRRRSDGLLPWCGEIPADQLHGQDAPVDMLRVIRPFAESLRAKSNALGQLDLPKRQAASFRQSMLDDLKKCSDLLVPNYRPVLISAAARSVAQELGIDLAGKGWHAQHQFDKGRLIFHWEHITPLAQLLDRCLATCTVGDIQEQIHDHLFIAWITKGEDGELTRLGYKSIRPDPWAAYRDAGIELLGTLPTGMDNSSDTERS